MKAFIYTLSDPLSPHVIKYVGKTNNPYLRSYTHVTPKNISTNTPKNAWIKKLLKEGREPQLEVIDEVPVTEWQFWERYWIDQFKAWGFKLKNLNPGGEGNNGPRSESFKRKLSLLTKGIKLGPQTEEHRKNHSIAKKALWESIKSNPLLAKIRQEQLIVARAIAQNSSKKKVSMVDESDNVIVTFDSILDAAKFVGRDRQTISKYCKKKVKVKNHFFKFQD